MLHFRNRRMLALALTAIVAVATVRVNLRIEQSLGHASYFSGATLLACTLLLVLLGLRKRLVMLPLWSVSTWVQIHIYAGLFTLVVYALHVPRMIASGVFEGSLSVLFLSVSSSGLYGLYISRTAPRKMTAVPGDYRFERIGWHRERLAERAAEILRGLEASVASPVLGTFYRDALQPYFANRAPLAFVAVPNSIRRRRLLSALKEIDRYLADDTRAAAGQLASLVRTRDELDFHFALQLRLRLWVAFHSLLSMVLLAWSLVHVLLVMSFI